MLTSCVDEKDLQVLTILFHRYARLVRSVAYRILGHWPEADDVLQEVFLSAYSNIAGFDFSIPKARFWLVQTTWEYAMARRRDLGFGDGSAHGDLESCLHIHFGQQKTKTVRATRAIELQARDRCSVVESLPEEQRKILELYFWRGYTLDQIARELGRSRETVRQHYFRSLEKLRKEMFSAHVQASV